MALRVCRTAAAAADTEVEVEVAVGSGKTAGELFTQPPARSRECQRGRVHVYRAAQKCASAGVTCLRCRSSSSSSKYVAINCADSSALRARLSACCLGERGGSGAVGWSLSRSGRWDSTNCARIADAHATRRKASANDIDSMLRARSASSGAERASERAVTDSPSGLNSLSLSHWRLCPLAHWQQPSASGAGLCGAVRRRSTRRHMSAWAQNCANWRFLCAPAAAAAHILRPLARTPLHRTRSRAQDALGAHSCAQGRRQGGGGAGGAAAFACGSGGSGGNFVCAAAASPAACG